MSDQRKLHGVIAAIATPFDLDGNADIDAFVAFAKRLLDEGCDGLNVCGTTGEATSMSVAERLRVMEAAASALPLDRLMVGTGAAAIADAIELTTRAGELGFAGALLLPPFYYKNVPDAGVVDYFNKIADASSRTAIPLYLYNFPALSGVKFSVDLINQIAERTAGRLKGLKDSSGDLDYASTVAKLPLGLDVFPSNEAILIEARNGKFAGCISATANLNSEWCQAAYASGDSASLEIAKQVRGLASDGALIPRVKALIAAKTGNSSFARLLPPHVPISADEQRLVKQEFDRLTSKSS